MNLIIPAAGKSTRFPNVRPKWLLTHPNGNLMVIEAIKGLNLMDFDNIFLVVLKEHIEKYNCLSGIKEAFKNIGINEKLTIVQLESSTQSQPETVAKAIEQCQIKGSIFIKDTDNFFKATITPFNQVAACSLEAMNVVNPVNKSYITVSESDEIKNIAEKKIISSTFCTGGYSFQDAAQFLKYYHSLEEKQDLFISHIIFKMILDGAEFRELRVSEYSDWGTLTDWNRYKEGFATLFIDIDGVLVFNSGEYFEPKWGETQAINENIEVINQLYKSGKVHIILTTSRSSKYKEETINQLKREGILYHQILFDLLHAKRIIINDYSPTNPYKSADAINLKRDSNVLKELLSNNIDTYFE